MFGIAFSHTISAVRSMHTMHKMFPTKHTHIPKLITSNYPDQQCQNIKQCNDFKSTMKEILALANHQWNIIDIYSTVPNYGVSKIFENLLCTAAFICRILLQFRIPIFYFNIS